ncbi:MAG: Rab family GTPase [Candidatus Thorarchaeota archaeon]
MTVTTRTESKTGGNPMIKARINTSVFKTVMIGEGGVGKTSITLRFTEDRFDENMMMTIGANFASKKMTFNESPLTLMIWDLGGQPRFRDVISDYFRGSKIAIAVYDATRLFSLERLVDWIESLKENAPGCDLVLVGNKTDLQTEGSGVSLEEGIAFAEKYNALHTQVSAKSGEGVDEMFELVAISLAKKYMN